MAVLNKMRERAGLIFAGLAGAFLLMIVFEWGAQGDFFKSGRKADEIGEVNGYKIGTAEYEQVLQNMRQQKLQQLKKKTLNEGEEGEVRDDAWNQLVVSKIIEQKADEYNIKVTDQEIRDIIYYNPPDFLKRGFIDSTGQFMEKEYFQAVRDPHNDTIVRNMVLQFRDELRRIKLQGFLQALSRMTNSEMWERYDMEHSKATVNVVSIKPTTDEAPYLSKVSDAEIKSYYDAHQWQYKQDEAKKIKFVIFRELPSPRDSAQLAERLDNLKKRWLTIPLTEPDSVIADLALDFTEEPYQGIKPINISQLKPYANAGELMHSQPGDVVILRGLGQYLALRVYSVMDTGEMLYHTRHILVGFGKPENKDSARAAAKKIYDEVVAGGDFATLAKKYSSDGSGKNGGDLGWGNAKSYVPPFAEAISKGPIGKTLPVFESQFGFHVVEVLEKSNRTINAATIPVTLKSSSQTMRAVEQQARVFREQASKKGFDQAAKDINYRVISDVPPITKAGQPIFSSRPFVNYVLTLSPGDITEPFKAQALKATIVAQVTENIPKGTAPLDADLKLRIRHTLAHKKLIESLQAKAKELRAMVGPGEGLDKLRSIDSTYSPKMLTMGPGESVSGLGTEYIVNTTAYQLKTGEVSQPLKGDNGYYIIQLVAINPASKQTYEAQKQQLFQQLNQEKQQRFFSAWFDKLKEQADIVDYRTRVR
jgi:parvulin-like peptidyl-prolyl isomerase